MVINIPPVSENISTTIQTPDGGVVLINVSRSSCFVGFEDGWLNIGVCLIHCASPEWVCDTYQEFTDPLISVDNET